MSSLTASLITFICLMGGVISGFSLGRILPGHHLNDESKDTIKLAAGTLATLSALVLGLLIASAKTAYDDVNGEYLHSNSKIILLDRQLAAYGPDAKPARDDLRQAVTSGIDMIWPEEGTAPNLDRFASAKSLEQMQARLDRMVPTNDLQRSQLDQARQINSDLMESRWLLVEQNQNDLPSLFFIILLVWLTFLFTGIGLISPRHGTTFFVLFVCVLAFSSAIFLILEMYGPLDGYIKISSAPMHKALEVLDTP